MQPAHYLSAVALPSTDPRMPPRQSPTTQRLATMPFTYITMDRQEQGSRCHLLALHHISTVSPPDENIKPVIALALLEHVDE